MSEFTSYIRYVTGADNVVADALSRAPPQESGTVASMEECVVTDVIDYAAMARQQATDTGVQSLVAESNLQIVRCELPGVDEQLIVDMSTGKPRPLLPSVAPTLEPELCADRYVIASSGMVCPETYVI